jgi:hypothetical protein
VRRLAALFLGLLSGGMLVIAVALVPFWTSLPPAEFRAWFAANAGRIGQVMIPLGAGAAIFSVLAAVGGSRGRGWLLLAAGGAAAVALITAVVNEPANEHFAAGTLTDPETVALLARWARWHYVRLGCGLVGFYASLRALSS